MMKTAMRKCAIVLSLIAVLSLVSFRYLQDGHPEFPCEYMPSSGQENEQYHQGNDAPLTIDNAVQGVGIVPADSLTDPAWGVCRVRRNYANRRQWCAVETRERFNETAAETREGTAVCSMHCLPSVVVAGASASGTTYLSTVILGRYEIDSDGDMVRPFLVAPREVHFITSRRIRWSEDREGTIHAYLHQVRMSGQS